MEANELIMKAFSHSSSELFALANAGMDNSAGGGLNRPQAESAQPLPKLDAFNLVNAGIRIGRELGFGQVLEARNLYDAVVNQIESDKSQPDASAQARLKLVQQAMMQQDPIDVKGPGNGVSDDKYLIYWAPEAVVNDTLKRVEDLAKTMPNGNLEDASDQDQTALGQALRDLNARVAIAMPDALERWAFIADFNRRSNVPGIAAMMDQYFNTKIVGTSSKQYLDDNWSDNSTLSADGERW